MGRIVIVAYRPKSGREADLLELARTHVPMLRDLGFATERAPIVMRDTDGVIVEIFEWTDHGIAQAHENGRVQAIWRRYAEVCDYVPLNGLPQAAALFAEFEPVEFARD